MDPNEEDLQRAAQAALRLLAARDYCRAELERKLIARGLGVELIAPVLDDLERQNALSDERFTDLYIESRIRKGFGPLRIGVELREKGVDRELVDCCLRAYEARWPELLCQAAARKFGPLPAGDLEERARRARFLEYRGFAAEAVRRYVWDDDGA